MTKAAKIESWLPYALPVLGGLMGVVWVNLNKFDFINPVLGIGLGAIAGWAAARIILTIIRRSRH